jgi:uncharacterized membrane protein YdjX (TVP38/TMEM64 family)
MFLHRFHFVLPFDLLNNIIAAAVSVKAGSLAAAVLAGSVFPIALAEIRCTLF